MAPLTHNLLSTNGNFITNSGSFEEVSDTSLVFEAENGGTIYLTGFVWISGVGTEVGMMVDGSIFQSARVSDSMNPVQVGFNMAMVLAAGPHRISMVLRTIDGDFIPEGPREWSPRKKKKSRSWAMILRNPSMPLAITATVV